MAKQTIQIADKPTLDTAKHSIWLNDYKTYGEDSFVFNNKDILHELYRDYNISMNDNKIASEALDFAVNNDEIGLAMSMIYGVSDDESISSLDTLSEIARSEEAMSIVATNNLLSTMFICNENGMTAFLASEIATTALVGNSEFLNTIVASDSYMGIVVGDETIMEILVSSSEFVTLLVSNSTAMGIVVGDETIMEILVSSSEFVTLLVSNSTAMSKVAESEIAMNVITANQSAMLILYNNYTATTVATTFLGSRYLLSACQNSPLYEVTVKAGNISTNTLSARRTHFSGKCLILGMSQGIDYNGAVYSSYVDTLNNTVSATIDKTYGNTGLVWRINRFGNGAKCHPMYGSYSATVSGNSYMAILKIS